MSQSVLKKIIIILLILFSGRIMADNSFDSTQYYTQVCDSFSNYVKSFHAVPNKFNDAISWFKRNNNEYLVAKTRVLLADYYSEQSEYDSACNNYLTAISTLINIKRTDSISTIYNSLASCEYDRGSYRLSIKYFQEGLKFPSFKKINEGNLYAGLAMSYDELGLLDSAITTYGKAISIYQDINDSLGIAYMYSNIGSLYLKREELFPDAKEYLLQAYKYLKAKDDKPGLAAVITNLAYYYSKSKNYKAELASYKEAYAIDSALNNPIEISYDLVNIGLLYANLGDTIKAIKTLRRSLSIANSIKAKQLIALSAYNLSDLLLEVDSIDESEKLAKISYENWVKMDTKADQLNALQLLSDIYSKNGEYKKAFQYLSDYTDLYDSVFSREKVQLLTNAKEKYEAVQRQNKILALEQKNLKETNTKKLLYISVILISSILIIIIIISLSANKNRKQTLRQKQYFSKLLSSSIEYKFVLGKDRIIKYVSPSFTHMFFGKEGDSMEDSFLKSLTEKDIENCKSGFLSIVEGKKVIPFDYQVKDINGIERFVTGKAQNYLDDELIKGIIVTLWDITDLKKTDQALKKREKELEEANKTKEKLFSIISHDLLGHVGTSSELMKLLNQQYQDFDQETIKKIISSVSQSLESTNTLVVNLLSWARIQMKKISSNRETTLLYPILESVIKLYESQLIEKSITIQLECDRTILVMIDTNQMEIVFRNLLRNAIKFTQNGGNIKFYCENNKPLVNVCIEDNGVGMNESQVRRLTERKSNLKSTSGTNNEQGTGLGVIIVKEFVHLNKGKIKIKSEPGKGTKVCITLLS